MAVRNLPEMPCGPILELHGQRKRFHIPFGLKPLIEDMTREVLRYQPDNIYEFLATFMEARLDKRYQEEEKHTARKSWMEHRWSWEGTSLLKPEELQEFLETYDTEIEEANHHAVVIQAAFRGYQARKKVKSIRKSMMKPSTDRKSLADEDEDGNLPKRTSVQQDGATDTQPKEKRASRASGDARRPTLQITAENITEEEEKSAVIIQSAFRGMQSRKKVKELRIKRASKFGGDTEQSGEEETDHGISEGEEQESGQADTQLTEVSEPLSLPTNEVDESAVNVATDSVAEVVPPVTDGEVQIETTTVQPAEPVGESPAQPETAEGVGEPPS